MTRKVYEEYEYIDPDNLYTYKNSSVLINRYDERDEIKARELEYKLVATQTLKLCRKPIKVYSVSDILAIHDFLFWDMYSWAGQYRQVNISKGGNSFMPIQSFDIAETYLNKLISEYHQNAQTREEVISSLTDILYNLNYFHPFREGNGRCQREVIRSLALMKGYECEISLTIDESIYHLYMDGTVYGDKKKLAALFEKILVKI